MVRQEDRLRRLRVGSPRHDRVLLAPSRGHQGALQVEGGRVQLVHPASRPEAQVRGHLVVAGSARVHLPAEGADARGQCHLQVEMHVLEGRIPGDPAGRHLIAQALQPVEDRGRFLRRQQAGAPETLDVPDGRRDVVERQLPVDLDRPREIGGASVALLGEAAAPGLQLDLTGCGASATWTDRSLSIGCVQLQAEPWREASVFSGRPKMRMKPTAASWSKASSAS